MSEVPPAPAGLRERGAALWVDLHEDRDRGPDERTLIVEACRMADRLDQLHVALSGEPWLLVERGDSPLILVVDHALGEARRTAMALKQLVGELRLQREPGVKRGGVPVEPAEDPRVEVDPIDELRARREGRVPDTSG